MAWVKRNLIFVIVVAIGLVAAGYCGFLLRAVMAANAEASSKFVDAQKELQTERDSKPPATPENLEAAKADQERVKSFLADFRKSFAPFPVAPKVDERGFADHLQITFREFTLAATNAGVEVPPGYGFSFGAERSKMTFAPECIDGWMDEIEQVRVILRILFDCKINYLESIQRVSICPDDNDGNDTLPSVAPGSNTWGVVMPYRLVFRGFSTEVANVLASFADSSNCFIVKYVNVEPSRVPLPQLSETIARPAPQRMMTQAYENPYEGDDGGGGGTRGRMRRPRPQQMQMEMPVVPQGPAPPETILQETPLYITMVVDAVDIKRPEPPPPVEAAKPKRPGR
jgi:hypothetical protein